MKITEDSMYIRLRYMKSLSNACEY